ncbi:hypothetical protein A3K63_02675 [Candidatus Micrarchaeota archaeon RBG_16_49_10]|nr:MAG: hypothetical protein A3K63_02675 [Candidatus Micrarchaeota archaeon RBG_16_49_10]
MIKMELVWKFLVIAVIFAVISQGIHTIAAFLEMKYYLMPEYFSVWSKLMMPGPGPPPLSFTLLSVLVGTVTAVIYSFAYLLVMKWIPGSSSLKKGANFGLMLFFVGVLPGYLALMLLINLPLQLIFYWMVEGLIINVLAGILIVRILG